MKHSLRYLTLQMPSMARACAKSWACDGLPLGVPGHHSPGRDRSKAKEKLNIDFYLLI